MSSPVIPREKLSAYQRWEMNSFDDGSAAGAAAEPARTDPRAQREGYDAGYATGLAAAKTEAARTAAAQAARFNQVIAALNREIAEFDTQMADSVLDLALTIARRMAGEALNVRPEMVVTVVREALQLLGQARAPAQLLLHPDDAALVREHLGDQCTAGGWIITDDAKISRGGCRLLSAGGELDATLEARWHRLFAAFGRTGDWLA